MKYRTKTVDLRLTLSGTFNSQWIKTTFFKQQYCSTDSAKISFKFTDKASIFIDVSVNGSDFAKGSAAHHLLNHCTWPRLRAKRWFLRFARNLRPHCLGEDNRVEHFSNFGWFCSTLRAARAEFGGGGRTFSQFWMILFYFLSREDRIWRQR